MPDDNRNKKKRIWRLSSDVVIKPVTELPDELIGQIAGGEKDPEELFAIERRKARAHMKIINRDVMDVLNRFGQDGATYEEVLDHFLQLKGLEREELDPKMRRMIKNFVMSNFLVEGEKKDDASEAIEPDFEEKDRWLSYRILENVHVIVDTEIYRVEHITSGELRALKISRGSFPNQQMKEKIFQRLRKEFGIIEKIDSPYTVKVWEYGEHDGRIYGVLDWIDGSSVRSYAYSPDQPPSRDLLLRLSIECLEGLHAVHQAGYLHGDVHAGNFLVREGQVCLIDFGLARPIQVDEKDVSKHSEGGVTEYMPPEYARHKKEKRKKLWGSVAGEIYSAGVIIFALFTGKYPYTTSFYRKDFLQRVLNDPPPGFEECESEPWPELEAILRKALAKEPSRRYRSAEEFAGELEKLRNSPERDSGG